MKIASIEPILIKVPYRHGGASPVGDVSGWPTMDTLLVKVSTDDGVVGWGEAFGFGGCASTRTAINTLIAPLCVGQDSQDIAGLTAIIERKLHHFGRAGQAVYALSGLDIALWDIAGKRAGLPLHRMLGTPAVAQLPAYASLLRYGAPDRIARITAEALERGYQQVKLHEVGVAEIKAAREVVGVDFDLMVDTNCPWSTEEALAVARQLAPLNLKWLEEPLWPPEDYEGMARLNRETGVPIAAGENASTLADFQQLIEIGRVAYLQPSVTKIGGVTAMLRVIEFAASHGVPIAPHSPYFGPGLIATLHISAGLPQGTYCERFYCDLEASPFGDQVTATDGMMGVPSGPGLGLEIDESVIARYRAE